MRVYKQEAEGIRLGKMIFRIEIVCNDCGRKRRELTYFWTWLFSNWVPVNKATGLLFCSRSISYSLALPNEPCLARDRHGERSSHCLIKNIWGIPCRNFFPVFCFLQNS